MKRILRRLLIDFKNRIIEHIFECAVFFVVFTVLFASLYVSKTSEVMEMNIGQKFSLSAEIICDHINTDSREESDVKEISYNNFVTNLAENTSYSYYDYNLSTAYSRPVKMVKYDGEDTEFYALGSADDEMYFEDFENAVKDLENGRFFYDIIAPRSTRNAIPKEFAFDLGTLAHGRYFTDQEIRNNDLVCIIPDILKVYSKDGKADIEVGDKIVISEIIVNENIIIENIPHEFTVIGIYKSLNNTGFNINSYITEHPIYISEGNFRKIYNHAESLYNQYNSDYLAKGGFYVYTNAIFKFDTISDFRFFINYCDYLNETSNTSYAVNSNADNIYLSVQNVLYTSNIISYIAYLMMVTAGIIIFMICLYKVRNRRKEIGILISFGERTINIVIQYFLETAAVFAVSIIPSMFLSGYIGRMLLDNVTEGMELLSYVGFEYLSAATFVPSVLTYVTILLILNMLILYILISRVNPKNILEDSL